MSKQKHAIENCIKYMVGHVFRVIFYYSKLMVTSNKENKKGQSEGS